MVVVDAEVVGELVQQRLVHVVVQLVLVGAHRAERQPEQRHAIGHRSRVADRAPTGLRDALVETDERSRSSVCLLRGGLVLDDDRDVLFGLYEGVPLTERTSGYGLVLPDKITIFQEPLEQEFYEDAELIAEVRRTVLHELAHHFGIDDDQLERLGLD